MSTGLYVKHRILGRRTFHPIQIQGMDGYGYISGWEGTALGRRAPVVNSISREETEEREKDKRGGPEDRMAQDDFQIKTMTDKQG
jgi:hypothetical protein